MNIQTVDLALDRARQVDARLVGLPKRLVAAMVIALLTELRPQMPWYARQATSWVIGWLERWRAEQPS